MGKLTSDDYAKLGKSCIPPLLADLAKIYRVDENEGPELVGRKYNYHQSLAGIVFPYFWPGNVHPREFRLRRDTPDYEYRNGNGLREVQKYLSPPGKQNKVYFPPSTDPDWLTRVEIPIVITEGEKKALALHWYFTEKDKKVLVFAIAGVSGWRCRVEKITDEKGKSRDVKGPLPDFNFINWSSRDVTIVYDSNAETRPEVAGARRGLSYELKSRKAYVYHTQIPEIEGVNGIDDLLFVKGVSFVDTLFEKRVSFNPKPEPATELGDAERFQRYFGDDTRYVKAWGKWLLWDGTKWSEDKTAEVHRLSYQTMRLAQKEAFDLEDADTRSAYVKWTMAGERRARLENMLALAQSLQGIATQHDILDSDPWALNCKNGTIDLRTGELKPHSKEDLITKSIPVEYNPDAECPYWEDFLHKIMGESRNMVEFLQRAVGYSLTGISNEHVLLFAYGGGSNGKSTFFETLQQLLGKDYWQKATTSLLTVQNNGSSIPNDVARLQGARMVVASELEEGHKLKQALVKDLTGGDTITARYLRQEFFEFKPTYTLWMFGNHKPVIPGTDEGIWRRVKLIPFAVTIPEEGRIKGFKEQFLFPELPGILAWAVRGCLEWQSKGLSFPEEVRKATDGYRAEQDALAAFLGDCCIQESNCRVKSMLLYEAYKQWCDSNNERDQSQRAFCMKLSERGFEKYQGTGNYTFWRGIGLLSANEES